VSSVVDVEPLHVAAWIEGKPRQFGAERQTAFGGYPSYVRLAGDWANRGGQSRFIGARPVTCGESGKTPILDATEARHLLASIDATTHAGLRDRALIALMVYSSARIGAALGMKVEDVYTQNRRLWVRLREKGGKRHEMPCHHNLEEYLVAYLDNANLRDDSKGPLFRTIGRGTQTHRHLAGAGECPRYDSAPHGRGRDWDQSRKSQFSGDRHYVLS
jgi:integrase/recombinase XerC